MPTTFLAFLSLRRKQLRLCLTLRPKSHVVFVLILAWMLMQVFDVPVVFACSCAHGLSDMEGKPAPTATAIVGSISTVTAGATLESYSAVFVGRVIASYDNPEPKPHDFDLERAVVFDVDRAFRGVDQTQIVVYTNGPECCTCGYSFDTGQSYLVFASESSNHFTTDICTPTRLLDYAQDKLQALGPGTKPTVQVSLYNRLINNPVVLTGEIAAGMLVIVFLVLFVRKTKSK